MSPTSPLDVLVIGGGQAGLAMGYQLAQRGLNFQIVDAGAEIGDAWRLRWDSLLLFTPAQYANLPGLPFPAAHDTYPGKDEVADYLQAYAAQFKLPVRANTKVTSLTRTDATYVAKAGAEAVEARQAVVATGPFQVPFVPPIANQLDPDVAQFHSVDYRRPEAIPPGRVLVVGAANSGCQIAEELSATHSVELSAGQRIPTVPPAAAGSRCVVVGDQAGAGPGDRRLAPWETPGRSGPGDRGWPAATRQAPRRPAPAPGDGGGGPDGDVRRR
jgi:putative flavoprotein involved in K+ transport